MTEPLTGKTIVADDGEPIDGLVSVYREADDSWRHGSYISQVFHRKADDTYWHASYRLSTNQETNELAEGAANVFQVEPYSETVIRYRPCGSGPDPKTALILVAYEKGFGRMGTLEGLFITTAAELEECYGKRAYFGEVLGKHSEIISTLAPEMFTVMSNDPVLVGKLDALVYGKTVSGFNPLHYVEGYEEPEDEDED
jgi:hypothetical protein